MISSRGFHNKIYIKWKMQYEVEKKMCAFLYKTTIIPCQFLQRICCCLIISGKAAFNMKESTFITKAAMHVIIV